MRKDFLGNPLKIGDEVVLAGSGNMGTVTDLEVGRVVDFKPVMIVVAVQRIRRYRNELIVLHILRKPTALMKLVR